MTLAYSYIRMSTTQQLTGDSLRRQTEKATEYAKVNGLELDQKFKLTDIGFSAYDGSNVDKGSLGLFLASIKEKRIPVGSVLIVESLDRLSRQNPKKALSMFLDIVNHGITIVTLMDGKKFEPESTDPMDLFMAILVMARANDESSTKSYRGKQAWAKKRDNANIQKLTARAPSWLKKSGNAFTVVESRAETVRQIFKRAIEFGEGTYKITHHLNKFMTPTFTDRTSIWGNSSVKKILASRSVYGEYHPHTKIDGKRHATEQVITDYYPTIVPKEIFDIAQQRIRERLIAGGGRKGAGFSNLFTKIAVCAYCGCPMHMGDKGYGKFLVCSSYQKGSDCFGGTWKYDSFERLILTYVRDLDPSTLLGNSQDTTDENIASTKILALKGALIDLREKRERAFELATTKISSDFFRQNAIALDTQVTEAEADLSGQIASLDMLKADKLNATTSGQEIGTLIANLQRHTDNDNASLRAKVHMALLDLIGHIQVFTGGLSIRYEPTDNMNSTKAELLLNHRSTGEIWHGTNVWRKWDTEKRLMHIHLKNGKLWEIAPSAEGDGIDWVVAVGEHAVTRDEIEMYEDEIDLSTLEGYAKAYQRVIEDKVVADKYAVTLIDNVVDES
jgi:DNA invertase Pin-like site-specific DNA recombinase